MKKLSIYLGIMAIAAGSYFPFMAEGSTCIDSCGYKKKGCWFSSKTKCSGNGNDCPFQEPCNGSIIQ